MQRLLNLNIKKKYGLVGKRLDYSFSKDFFTRKAKEQKLDISYENFEFSDLTRIREFMERHSICGFNVTIPYKKSILDLVDEKTPAVEEIGAANCIQVSKNQRWIAHNTDVIGFEHSLLHFIKQAKPKALLFGTGGASRAVQFVLDKLNINYLLVSRKSGSNRIQYNQVNKKTLEEYKLLINATPVGTFPDVEVCIPIPYDLLNANHFCYDLIYNPAKTSFLAHAELKGARIKNGLEMLKIQAEESWNIWNI